MKTILSFVTWFLVAFAATSVLTSAMAAESVQKPVPPPTDCSCGACE